MAEDLLAQGDVVRAGPRGLHAATATQTSALQWLVAQAAGSGGPTPVGGAIVLEHPSLKRPLQVLISPLRTDLGWAGLVWQSPAVLVLVIDPERTPETPEQQLRTLYHLTHTEAWVAREVVKGEGVVTVAASLGMLPSTARTHLHHVFEKTGTQRQAELVRLLERLALLAHQEELTIRRIGCTEGYPWLLQVRLVLRLMGCLVLFYASRVLCQGQLRGVAEKAACTQAKLTDRKIQ